MPQAASRRCLPRRHIRFPLTPALSLRGEGEWAGSVSAKLSHPVGSSVGVGGSLSLRERVGVRGNELTAARGLHSVSRWAFTNGGKLPRFTPRSGAATGTQTKTPCSGGREWIPGGYAGVLPLRHHHR